MRSASRPDSGAGPSGVQQSSSWAISLRTNLILTDVDGCVNVSTAVDGTWRSAAGRGAFDAGRSLLPRLS